MQLIKNIFSLLQKPEKQRMLLLTILDVVVSLLDIFFLIALLFMIDLYTGTNRFSKNLPALVKIVEQQPLLPVGMFTLLFAFKNWFAFFSTKKQYYFIYDVASRLSQNRLANYLDGSYSNYVNIDSSVHMRIVFNNPMEFAHYILRGVQQIISHAILILFALIPIIAFKPVLFSLLLAVLFPPVILLSVLLKKRLQRLRNAAKTINSKLIQYLKEALAGFVESNVYRTKDFFLNRFASYQQQQSQSISEQQITQSLPPRLIEVFAIVGLFFLIMINHFTNGRSVDMLTIGAFIAAAYKIIPGIVKIWNSLAQIKTYEFIVSELLQNQSAPFEKIKQDKPAINSIKFLNVNLAFKNKQVINNFSLEIKRGDFIGLSGKSGKGKTSTVNLLLGFLEPDQESILINDSIKNSSERHEYWENISYVQQRTFLINDSILKNITLKEGHVNQERLKEVIRVTGIDQIINGSGEGLHKGIMEDGKNISGGQRQRIALARALYKNSDLLILDEPFNELDTESENCILHHLKEKAQSGKMIILITHKKESLSFCNKIVSLDEN